jgi:spore maturation protein CgeB
MQKNIKYLHARHPAEGKNSFFINKNHPLLGEGFSKHINSCLGFINTGGIYKTPNPRTIEILASKACLFAFESFDRGMLYLQDGKNYICINEENAIDKIEFYIQNTSEMTRIAGNGYELAMKEHSCFARARQFEKMIFGVDDE